MLKKLLLVCSLGLICSLTTAPPSGRADDVNTLPKFEVTRDSIGDIQATISEFYDIQSVGFFVDSINIRVQIRTAGKRGYTGSDTGYFVEFDTDFDNEIDLIISLLMNPAADQSLVMASTGTTFSLKRNTCFKLKYHEDAMGFDVVMCKKFLQLDRAAFQWRVSSEVSTSYGFSNDFAPNQEANQSLWFQYDGQDDD